MNELSDSTKNINKHLTGKGEGAIVKVLSRK